MTAAPPPPPPPYQPHSQWESPKEPKPAGISPIVVALVGVAALAIGLGAGAALGLTLGSDDDPADAKASDSSPSISESIGSQPTVYVTETETFAPSPEPTPEPEPEPDSIAAIPGDGDVIDGWELVGELDIHHDSLRDFEVRFRATNVSDRRIYDAFSMTVLKKEEILAILDCGNYNRVDPGRVVTFECTTTDNFKEGWTAVEMTYDG
ncbi:hypothetical protein F0U44_02685 [Nocardioides humilatus]|uniref:Uncharacterized protein n=1 Tax=Nocardioides humilatus TaxID=2607660 RepID=A0A5B1LKF6_9ACTN|nr:hypothetical protein [Nocardioides humilatus]KAA1421235.1 hypothetical protein F0U44_02685 [Nocardioides humilatus]